MTVLEPDPVPVTYPARGDAAAYADLLRSARTTGRCPVWTGSVTRFGWMAEVPDLGATVAAVDPAEVLARWWPGPCPQGCECLAPFTGEFPGLLRSGSVDRSSRRATVAEAVSFALEAQDLATLAVVESQRPADVIAALRWAGACNYGERDLASMCAVLRSWEERFGASVVWVADATLVLAVADPPRTREDAERVAAEHFAFCPDQHDPQTGPDPYTIPSYGRRIRRNRLWRFWWD